MSPRRSLRLQSAENRQDNTTPAKEPVAKKMEPQKEASSLIKLNKTGRIQKSRKTLAFKVPLEKPPGTSSVTVRTHKPSIFNKLKPPPRMNLRSSNRSTKRAVSPHSSSQNTNCNTKLPCVKVGGNNYYVMTTGTSNPSRSSSVSSASSRSPKYIVGSPLAFQKSTSSDTETNMDVGQQTQNHEKCNTENEGFGADHKKPSLLCRPEVTTEALPEQLRKDVELMEESRMQQSQDGLQGIVTCPSLGGTIFSLGLKYMLELYNIDGSEHFDDIY